MRRAGLRDTIIEIFSFLLLDTLLLLPIITDAFAFFLFNFLVTSKEKEREERHPTVIIGEGECLGEGCLFGYNNGSFLPILFQLGDPVHYTKRPKGTGSPSWKIGRKEPKTVFVREV
jgi:hypothetical protein